MFRLKTLGGALLEGPDGPLTGAASQRRRLAVLALLAASGGGLSRDRLVAMLWPDSDEERARHALAQLLYALRRELGGEVVTGSATALRLNPELLTSDVQEFEQALSLDDPRRAAGLYDGPFLDGFFLNGCPEFERWVEEVRARLAGRAQQTLEKLAQRTAAAGDAAGAVQVWQRLAALAPFDSRVALALMKAMAAAGDRAGAVRHARLHKTLLQSELDALPDPAIAAYVGLLASEGGAGAALSPAPGSQATQPMPASLSAQPAGATPVGVEAPPSGAIPGDGAKRPRRGVLVAAGLVVLGAVIVVAMALGAPAGGGRQWVLIADAENLTGDAVFDRTLPVALAAALRQSSRVYVTAPERVRTALQRMRRPGADSLLDETLARDIAQREGIRVVIVPTITRADSSYEITARLIDPVSGSVLAAPAVRAARRGGVVDALDQLGRRTRRELGESLLSVATHTVPLPRVTTPSVEALKKYADGNRAFITNALDEAGRLWQQAVTIDTMFGSAWAALGMLYFWVNRPTTGDAYFTHALAHIGDLPEREQVMIRATIAAWRGSRDSSTALLRTWLRQNDDDIDAWGRLGYDYMRMRRPQEALEALTRVVAFDSMDHTTFINLATVEKQLGRLDEAIAHYRRAFRLMPSLETANNNLNLEYGGALVQAGDLEGAAATFDRMLNVGQLERARGLRSHAFLAMYRGRYTEASRYLSEAVLLARVNDAGVTQLRNHLLLATALERRGLAADAAAQRDSAYAVSERMDAETTLLYWVGKSLARAGDTRRAGLLLARLERGVHEGSSTDGAAREALRGEVLVAEGRAAAAVPHLELALRADSTRFTLESLAHGVAAANGFERAAALYEELSRGGDDFGWEAQEYWRMALYWLGDIQERRGDAVMAVRAYQGFLDAWKEAEPALAPVVDARARIARLRSAGDR
jgi:DNA-binding SARP family transcriptional activator/Tfp pilus assembly protein PilF